MAVLENPRHEIFAREIAKGASQREAYQKAGYSGDEGSIDANASRLISDDKVMIRVAEIQKAAAKRAEVTIERTLLELAKIGYSDIRSAVKWGEGIAVDNDDGEPRVVNGVSLIGSGELDDDTAAAISEVTQTKDGLKIKMHDKLSALEKIGKHLGMFVDRVEQSGPNGGPIQTEEVGAVDRIRSRIAGVSARGGTGSDTSDAE